MEEYNQFIILRRPKVRSYLITSICLELVGSHAQLQIRTVTESTTVINGCATVDQLTHKVTIGQCVVLPETNTDLQEHAHTYTAGVSFF